MVDTSPDSKSMIISPEDTPPWVKGGHVIQVRLPFKEN